VLETKDLQQLRGLITNDPLRAIQVLPGVATGDDFKSEFTVRASPIDHMQFSFEGIGTPLLVHTVQRVVDTGSIAMINGDVLDEVALAGGAYPQRFGDRLGAEVDFRNAQSKAVYDVNSSNQLQLAFAAGRSRLSLDGSKIQHDDPQDASLEHEL
jgi:hypothetical protein